MRARLSYETLEKLPVGRPVDRLTYIAERCRDKTVLDIGCLDETALVKRDTEHWLHGRIRSVARKVVGIDSSSSIPPQGIVTGPASAIFRGDGTNIDAALVGKHGFDTAVAGEFIEHIENPLQFLRSVKSLLPGRELIISSPNGPSFANTLLGMIGREVQHPDHLQCFSFKILNTLCIRAGFDDWEIIPYRFFATEMILKSKGLRRLVVRAVECFIRLVEMMFPLLSFGYIVRIKLPE